MPGCSMRGGIFSMISHSGSWTLDISSVCAIGQFCQSLLSHKKSKMCNHNLFTYPTSSQLPIQAKLSRVQLNMLWCSELSFQWAKLKNGLSVTSRSADQTAALIRKYVQHQQRSQSLEHGQLGQGCRRQKEEEEELGRQKKPQRSGHRCDVKAES